jgi:hypothetical protein
MTETHTIKVAIVEDQREIREGLAQLVNGTPGLPVHRRLPVNGGGPR